MLAEPDAVAETLAVLEDEAVRARLDLEIGGFQDAPADRKPKILADESLALAGSAEEQQANDPAVLRLGLRFQLGDAAELRQ